MCFVPVYDFDTCCFLCTFGKVLEIDVLSLDIIILFLLKKSWYNMPKGGTQRSWEDTLGLRCKCTLYFAKEHSKIEGLEVSVYAECNYNINGE